VAKEQIDVLAKSLDRLTDTVRKLQQTRSEVPPASVIPASLHPILRSTLSSALEQINDKLRDIYDRIESMGSVGSNDGEVVSELVDKVLAAIADRKVSGKPQMGASGQGY
jgi:Mg2+ and Co2+ transporter CorA